jgi:PEP-CTERM motif
MQNQYNAPCYIALALATLTLTLCNVARAATIYGTNFDIVYNPADVGLFGLPTIGGDTVFFTPNNFKAESLGGAGSVTTAQSVVFDLVPHAGFSITGSGLTERGDYLLRNRSSQVSVGGTTRAVAIANPQNEVSDNIVATGPLTTLNVSTNWTATAFLDLSNLTADASGYRITVENILVAYTDPGVTGLRQAFIEKKFVGDDVVGLQIIGQAIPEPQTHMLLLAGVAMIGFSVRRSAAVAKSVVLS